MDFMRYITDPAANFTLYEKRPGTMKLIAPFYHEDGDMVDIFLSESEIPGKIRISDFGLSLMRLSYTIDMETEFRQRILESIIAKNNLYIDNGNIYVDVNPESLNAGIFQFAGAIGKICNIDILNREIVKSMFYDLLHQQIMEKFAHLNPKKDYAPINDKDLLVDYAFDAAKPLFLFAIQDSNKAKKTAIACLNFKNKNMKFRSVMVHEDSERLTSYDRKQLTNIADRQFTDLEAFKSSGLDYIVSEIA